MVRATRRETLGPFASAALPLLWKAIAKKGWSHSDLARAIDMSSPNATRLLYGDRGIGLEPALKIHTLFPSVRPLLWTKPIPPNWRPHGYPDHRRRARELAATGTDD